MDLKNMTAKEVNERIRHHAGSISDDEWLELNTWIDEFLKSNPPLEEKKLFGPLGSAEIVTMICDGIIRWRNSICIKCKNQQNHDNYHCSIYPRTENPSSGIPNEIWAHEDADCFYYEKL